MKKILEFLLKRAWFISLVKRHKLMTDSQIINASDESWRELAAEYLKSVNDPDYLEHIRNESEDTIIEEK